MKWLVVGDVHLDVKPPSSRRIDDYENACFRKLDQVLNLAIENSCEVIVCTGDWFHRKNPAQVPHRLVRRVMRWLTRCGEAQIPILTVAGNHDVQYGDANESNIGKGPIGVLSTHPNFKLLNAYAPAIIAKGGDYINGIQVAFTGTNYKRPHLFAGSPKEDISQYTSNLLDLFNVHVVHGNTLPTPPVWEPYTLMADAAANSTARVLHCGHIHDDLGVFSFTNKLGDQCIVTNVGSLMRGSLTEENRTRKPAVLVMEIKDYQGVSWRRIDLITRPAEEIYALKEADQEKEEATQISEWAKNLRSQLATQEEEEDLQQTIAKSNLDHPSRELALNILNECGE